MTSDIGPEALPGRRARRIARPCALAALFVAALTSSSWGRHAALSTSYQSWSWSETNVSELYTEIRLGFAPLPDLFVDVSSGLARVSGDDAPDLDGLADSRVSLTYQKNAWIFRVAVNAPTGQSELEDGQAVTASLVSDHLIALPSRVLGRGADLDVTVARSVELGDVVFGFSGGYLVTGSYDPFSGSRYEPGDRLSGTIAAELGTSRWTWRNTLRLRYAFTDTFEGEDFVENGLGWGIETLGLKRWVEWSLWGAFEVRDFGDPDVFAVGLDASDFGGRARTDVRLAVGARTHLSTHSALDMNVAARFLSGGAFQDGARRIDLAGRVTHRLSPSIQIAGEATLGYARLNDPSLQLRAPDGTDLTGAGLTLELRTSF